MNAIFLECQKMESYFHVRDRNSQQKLLPTYQKLRQIAVISLPTMKPTTARKQPFVEAKSGGKDNKVVGRI